jgi:glucosamine--fructose-6-phosphate aminotransferase (isomerizing)
MCGIFGQISSSKINKHNFKKLVNHSKQRGMDSSGLIYFSDDSYKIKRADIDIEKLLNKVNSYDYKLALGHSRLITNGLGDNQPVVRGNICALHNGIIVNEKEVWDKLTVNRKYLIDSEVIVAIAEEHLKNNGEISDLPNKVLSLTRGVVACAMLLAEHGKLILFSNNGSLYIGYIGEDIYFASERFALDQIACENIRQIKDQSLILDIPSTDEDFDIHDEKNRTENLIPEFQINTNEEKLLEYKKLNLKRCTKCILPDTMPYIKFDEHGVCNYCHNYKKRNKPKPVEELFKLVEPYRKSGKEFDCIVPFSGGRDSSYGLHLILEELKMKPLTYTYDWGMVTDLGRRNISRMCSEMGIENIIVAANISQKRKNIKMNLSAWLKSPHLGMMALLTAGDKHFFRHVERVKDQTGINLNLWGVNPLEQTHFKTGFLGIKPDFEEDKVYSNGIMKQLKYHSKRFRAMSESPSYFNSSLWDNLSGEYYRSFTTKKDYFHIFDYWTWDESTVNNILINQYDWETAIDTPTTWRIGDGTAGFYNYVYYTVAGFTEHDTFRSNQIREGQLSREEALKLVEIENFPRYQNIRWYLDTLGLDFKEVIKVINQHPKLYNEI